MANEMCKKCGSGWHPRWSGLKDGEGKIQIHCNNCDNETGWGSSSEVVLAEWSAQKKERTFTEAFLDDDTIPYGSMFWIRGRGYTKTVWVDKNRVRGCSLWEGGAAAVVFPDGEWLQSEDPLKTTPQALKESDIEAIYKPEAN